jgi:hypothetical protein
MASINRLKDGWRAFIYVRGTRESRVFRFEEDAAEWAREREAELRVGVNRNDLGEYGAYQPMTLRELKDLPAVTPAEQHCGVYFLWNISNTLVYVGQSKDVAGRVAYHRRRPPTDFFYATYCRVPHPWQLAIERIYIERYITGAGMAQLANCA